LAESFTPELRSGEVKALMNDWELPMMNLFAVFPAGRLASAKARAFALVCRAVHDRKAAGAIDHGEPGLFNIADPGDAVSTQKAMAQLGWRADFRIEAK
jgi:hypothetical protein